jgi:hypothetical protein
MPAKISVYFELRAKGWTPANAWTMAMIHGYLP